MAVLVNGLSPTAKLLKASTLSSFRDENPIERQLAEFTAETAGTKLQINDIPEPYFIRRVLPAA